MRKFVLTAVAVFVAALTGCGDKGTDGKKMDTKDTNKVVPTTTKKDGPN